MYSNVEQSFVSTYTCLRPLSVLQHNNICVFPMFQYNTTAKATNTVTFSCVKESITCKLLWRLSNLFWPFLKCAQSITTVFHMWIFWIKLIHIWSNTVGNNIHFGSFFSVFFYSWQYLDRLLLVLPLLVLLYKWTTKRRWEFLEKNDSFIFRLLLYSVSNFRVYCFLYD